MHTTCTVQAQESTSFPLRGVKREAETSLDHLHDLTVSPATSTPGAVGLLTKPRNTRRNAKRKTRHKIKREALRQAATTAAHTCVTHCAPHASSAAGPAPVRVKTEDLPRCGVAPLQSPNM